MNLRALAVFSILLMALIVAPQAALDFQTFLGSVETSMHRAFLHAILDSRTSESSVQQQTSSPETGRTVCTLHPAPDSHAVNTRQAAKRQATRHVSSVAMDRVRKNESSNRDSVEIAESLGRLSRIDLSKMPQIRTEFERVGLDQLGPLISNSPFVKAERDKFLNDESFQQALRIAICKKARALKESQKLIAVPVKAAWVTSEPIVAPLAPPAVEPEVPEADRQVTTAESE